MAKGLFFFFLNILARAMLKELTPKYVWCLDFLDTTNSYNFDVYLGVLLTESGLYEMLQEYMVENESLR